MKRAATVTAGIVLAMTASMGAASAAVADSGPPMPDFRGRGLMHVFNSLDYRTHVEVRDVSGTHRNVLWPFSWKVCTQSPAAGTKLDDQSVRIGVVKTDEKCPKKAAADD
ncbi:hypothetical protein [Streptomyces sp. NBC_01465]|uniref:hypothetical protein n=1 Tax=Streptomyces sp. NBC_01465 TaxID=2903878 RepID=UPI002E3738AC|nr:hypothetical protein [Streptomyces sp. NBC_01465]